MIATFFFFFCVPTGVQSLVTFVSQFIREVSVNLGPAIGAAFKR